MPFAHWKLKSKALNLHVPSGNLPEFSDVEVSQCSPYLCAICEHAGELVICDGPCHRQFHVRRSIQELPIAHCPGVCISEGNSSGQWHCLDCTTSRAKCFQCGLLGTMHSEVRKCLQTYCVCWYCRGCFPLEKSSCALHSCHACDLPFSSESLEDVVQCLRCPTSWHLDCLEHIQRKDVNNTQWGVDQPPWQHVAHDQIRRMVDEMMEYAIPCPSQPTSPVLPNLYSHHSNSSIHVPDFSGLAHLSNPHRIAHRDAKLWNCEVEALCRSGDRRMYCPCRQCGCTGVAKLTTRAVEKHLRAYGQDPTRRVWRGIKRDHSDDECQAKMEHVVSYRHAGFWNESADEIRMHGTRSDNSMDIDSTYFRQY